MEEFLHIIFAASFSKLSEKLRKAEKTPVSDAFNWSGKSSWFILWGHS